MLQSPCSDIYSPHKSDSILSDLTCLVPGNIFTILKDRFLLIYLSIFIFIFYNVQMGQGTVRYMLTHLKITIG